MPRTSSVLRCAFCHDDADTPTWVCDRCTTRLHEECFALVNVCPILGCSPRPLRVVLPDGARPSNGAGPWDLGVWLATFSSVWLALVWVIPKVTKLYEKRRQPLPVNTDVLLRLEHFAQSDLGILTAVAIVAMSIYVFAKHRERPWVWRSFTALTWLGFAFFPCAGFSAALPLVNMARV